MPIFRFPFFYNQNYYNRFAGSRMNNFTENWALQNSQHNSSDVRNKDTSKIQNNNSKSNDNDENYFFELFGLKLYSDDILLICLIFFLYQEGVKDDELFLSLVFLLLS